MPPKRTRGQVLRNEITRHWPIPTGATAYEEGLRWIRVVGSVANESRNCIPVPYGTHAIA
jgi:hypothetical protein